MLLFCGVCVPAAAIDKARRKKSQTYLPLLKQVLDRRRQNTPVFTPAAVTSFGELGPGCTVVQEWLAVRLKAHHVAAGDRPDGLTPQQLTARFRRNFRMAIVMTTVRRLGAMQHASGLPATCVLGAY